MKINLKTYYKKSAGNNYAVNLLIFDLNHLLFLLIGYNKQKGDSLEYPSFYDEVEKFILEDDLSAFLGATKGGIIEISYLDCVKLAGHSCPTVAGSYIVAKVATNRLFNGQTIKRSALKISFKESKDSGVTGVIGTVIGYILGCNDEGGFSGIGGKFNRANLLSYNNSEQKGSIKFTNIYTDESIELNLDTSKVPGDPSMRELMQKSLMGAASKEEMLKFQQLWQDRVEYMLLNRQIWNDIAKEI
jgi:formylmethanofuran dehydrogenase subunit E